jgi:hypothetical protein
MDRKQKESAFVNLAKNMMEQRGERSIFPGANPVVRGYVQGVKQGDFDDPARFAKGLEQFQEDFLLQMFPDEYDALEAQEIAQAAAEAKSRRPTRIETKPREPMSRKEMVTSDPVKVPEELRAGGRLRII